MRLDEDRTIVANPTKCWYCAELGCRMVFGVLHCPCPHHYGGDLPERPETEAAA